MFNVQQITSRLSEMSDGQLAQYARMHKDDPYILPLAAAESKRRQQIRQGAQMQQAPQATVADQDVAQMEAHALPEDRGIGVLPAQNIQNMADGGIAGYAEGGRTDEEKSKYRQYAINKARQMGLDPRFVDAIFNIESGYKAEAKSKTGPVGIGQLTKQTAKAFGLSPEERKDPYKNMDASMSLMQYLFGKYKDPAKVAVAYNQGEGVLNEHLKQNKGRLVPEKLHENVRTANKQEPVNYLRKLTDYIPIASASAEEVVPRGAFVPPKKDEVKNPFAKPAPAAAPTPVSTPAQAAPQPAAPSAGGLYSAESVPTTERLRAEEKARAAAQPPAIVQRGRELIGMPEATASLVTGALSPFTGTVYSGIQNLLGNPMTAEQGAAATTFTPRSSYGKESLSAAERAIEDFKIPPYIGHIPVPKTPARAPAATAKAATAAEAAAEAARRAETPRLTYQKPAPAGATPEAVKMAERAAEVRRNQALVAERQRLKALQDEAAATSEAAGEATAADTVAQQMLGEGLRASRATTGLGALGVAGQATPAPVTPEAPAPEGIDYMAPYSYGDQYFPQKEEAAPTPEATKEPEAEKPQTGGLSNEDILTMGLNMMMAPAGQPGNALSQLASNLGRSGLATLQAKREREKTAREADMNAIMQDYYKSLAAKQKLPPEEIALVERWAKDNNVSFSEAFRQIQEAKYDPRAAAALEQLRLKGALGMGGSGLYALMGGGQGNMYDINPGGSGTGFRVLGSREK